MPKIVISFLALFSQESCFDLVIINASKQEKKLMSGGHLDKI
jgi:hypothetical protein